MVLVRWVVDIVDNSWISPLYKGITHMKQFTALRKKTLNWDSFVGFCFPLKRTSALVVLLPVTESRNFRRQASFAWRRWSQEPKLVLAMWFEQLNILFRRPSRATLAPLAQGTRDGVCALRPQGAAPLTLMCVLIENRNLETSPNGFFLMS